MDEDGETLVAAIRKKAISEVFGTFWMGYQVASKNLSVFNHTATWRMPF